MHADLNCKDCTICVPNGEKFHDPRIIDLYVVVTFCLDFAKEHDVYADEIYLCYMEQIDGVRFMEGTSGAGR